MPRPKKIFNEEENKLIINMYMDGNKTKNIAKFFKVGEPRIIEELINANIKFRKRGELITRFFTNKEIEKIIEMYSNGFWIRDIEKELKTDGRKIVNVLRENGFNIDGSRKYTCDFNFFEEIDTEEKAYWLGFLFADGWVGKENVVGFGLKYPDKYHLYNFIKSINGTYPVYTDPSNNNFSTVHIGSGKMKNDLIDHGCVRRKSLILKPPINIPTDLNRHFIRGYFDGDGSVGFYPQYNKTNIVFLGTYDFLNWIQEDLKSIGIDSMTLKRKNNIFELYVYRKNNFKVFYDYMYNNSNIKLLRKYNIFINIMNHYCFN